MNIGDEYQTLSTTPGYLHIWPEIYDYKTNRNTGFAIGDTSIDSAKEQEAFEDAFVNKMFGQHKPGVWPAPQRIAMVSYLIEKSGHMSLDSYKSIVYLTIENLVKYSQRHTYPFFFLNDDVVTDLFDGFGNGYWAKLYILKHYLEANIGKIDWILYTDADVLIINQDIPLEAFIAPCANTHHFIGVVEPGHKSFDYYRDLIRSGFFMIRNSKEGRAFIDEWIASYETFKDIQNPEQSALENFFGNTEYHHLFCMHTSSAFHTYSEAYRDGMFSVHFPWIRKDGLAGFYEYYFGQKHDFLWKTIGQRQ
ncbi:hypothetical protein EDD86DRAFT_244757 [Gorgonomyces haynaldii]|nr:hypothetical protein EDD86DRAFT_244757 [Gorgonomyces haynaldii]